VVGWTGLVVSPLSGVEWVPQRYAEWSVSTVIVCYTISLLAQAPQHITFRVCLYDWLSIFFGALGLILPSGVRVAMLTLGCISGAGWLWVSGPALVLWTSDLGSQISAWMLFMAQRQAIGSETRSLLVSVAVLSTFLLSCYPVVYILTYWQAISMTTSETWLTVLDILTKALLMSGIMRGTYYNEEDSREQARRRFSDEYSLLANILETMRRPTESAFKYLHMLEGAIKTVPEQDDTGVQEILVAIYGCMHQVQKGVIDSAYFAGSRAGQLRVLKVNTELSKFLATIRRRVQSLCERRSIELLMSVDESVPSSIVIDRGQVEYCLSVLLTSAVLSSPRGAKVECALRRGPSIRCDTPQALWIRVADVGSPIDLVAWGATMGSSVHTENLASKACMLLSAGREGSEAEYCVCSDLMEMMGGQLHLRNLDEGVVVQLLEIPLPDPSRPTLVASDISSRVLSLAEAASSAGPAKSSISRFP
jgi:signal transduction histidine kinase